jgi:invasion protein IalB
LTTKRSLLSCAGLGLAAGVLLAGAGVAQTPEVVSRHERWTVYTLNQEGDSVCYASTPPEDSAPLNADHGEVAFIVATWRSGAAREQPMLSVGYTLRVGAPTSARVGSDRYPMFTDGTEAFVQADEDQPRLVRAMKRGYTMRLETVSSEGTQTTYEFSLRGVTAALDAVTAACR